MFHTGSDRPSLEALYDHVVNTVAGSGRWQNLGVHLLPSQNVGIIAKDHSRSVTSCCKRVLEELRETTADPTWNQLIRALRSPAVHLYYLAGQLEQMLITERKNL